MKLLLKNGVTHKEFEYSVTDLNESNIFYTFNINVPEEMDDGEYSYTLKDNEDKIVATGLIRVGDYKTENTQYNNNKDKKYVQYVSK